MNASDATMPVPEFYRPVEADSLIHGQSQKTLQASAPECAALSQRFAIDALNYLKGNLGLQRSGSGNRLKIMVHGQLEAEIVQTCVVSLEPFTTSITAEFDTVFDARADDDDANWELDPQADDPPEPIVDGNIDLGELLAQSLSLEIDLHPRKPGVEGDPSVSGTANHAADKGPPASENPFAALKNMDFKRKD
ncbi:MAG: DUF177 domain-containing protein [Rhodospirillales bacterium]|nr:DUF177 domain-containing protein [Rhodospirillales bacterium]